MSRANRYLGVVRFSFLRVLVTFFVFAADAPYRFLPDSTFSKSTKSQKVSWLGVFWQKLEVRIPALKTLKCKRGIGLNNPDTDFVIGSEFDILVTWMSAWENRRKVIFVDWRTTTWVGTTEDQVRALGFCVPSKAVKSVIIEPLMDVVL